MLNVENEASDEKKKARTYKRVHRNVDGTTVKHRSEQVNCSF